MHKSAPVAPGEVARRSGVPRLGTTGSASTTVVVAFFNQLPTPESF
jgi:hypothetical protein